MKTLHAHLPDVNHRLLALWMMFVLLPAQASLGISDWYVDASAAPGGDGSPWGTGTPFRYLSDAMFVAGSGDTIRVAEGYYRPDQAENPNAGVILDERTMSFRLAAGVSIEGGYAGIGGTSLLERDPVAYPSHLTGDIHTSALADNSFHVVTAENLTGTQKALLDGFTIERGYSFGVAGSVHCDNLTAPKNGGAGLYCYNASSLLVRDCVFTCNQAGSGAAIRVMCGSSPSIIGCTFEFNFASATGVSDLACGQIPATLGASGNGGAIHIFFEDSSPHIANCTFRHNGAGHDGGAVHAQFSAGADVRNCVFYANVAGLSGGGMRVGADTGAVVYNCTFAKNVASHSASAGGGGGLAMSRDQGDSTHATTLTNCVFWGNALSDCDPQQETCAGEQIELSGDSGSQALVVDWCDVQGGDDKIPHPSGMLTWGTHNFDADPQFASPANGDLHLAYVSPCVNAGDSYALPTDEPDLDGDGVTTEQTLPWDRDGATRVITGDCIDVGAYEIQSAIVCTGDISGPSGLPDGAVDGHDLAALLNQWGVPGGGVADIIDPGETPSPCGDEQVDGNDLSALLGAWGTCPSNLGAGGESESSPLVEFASGPIPIEVAESMGFASLDEFVAWLGEMDPESMAAWLMTIFGS